MTEEGAGTSAGPHGSPEDGPPFDRPPTTAESDRLRRIANYQFGAGGGEALFPTDATIAVYRTNSGRIEQVYVDGERIVTQGTDGRFTLSVAGGRRFVERTESPRYRVEVGDESVPFVREGRNAFAKFVQSVDPAIRPGDEAVVVHDGTVLGVGRAELSAEAMADFDVGVAVFVRHGAGD